MHDPRRPRRIPSIDDRTVLETALVSLATTGVFVAAMLAALVAASIAGDETAVSAPVAVLTGLATIGVAAIVLGPFRSRLARVVRRRRTAAP
ncbi:hypothetical protein [Natronobacterium haloterrestre]|nr:hypothetical protein [Halobiforma haloterrestris]